MNNIEGAERAVISLVGLAASGDSQAYNEAIQEAVGATGDSEWNIRLLHAAVSLALASQVLIHGGDRQAVMEWCRDQLNSGLPDLS